MSLVVLVIPPSLDLCPPHRSFSLAKSRPSFLVVFTASLLLHVPTFFTFTLANVRSFSLSLSQTLLITSVVNRVNYYCLFECRSNSVRSFATVFATELSDDRCIFIRRIFLTTRDARVRIPIFSAVLRANVCYRARKTIGFTFVPSLRREFAAACTDL